MYSSSWPKLSDDTTVAYINDENGKPSFEPPRPVPKIEPKTENKDVENNGEENVAAPPTVAPATEEKPGEKDEKDEKKEDEDKPEEISDAEKMSNKWIRYVSTYDWASDRVRLYMEGTHVFSLFC